MKIIKKILQNILVFITKYRYSLIIFSGLYFSYFSYLKINPILDKIQNYKFETLTDLKKYAEFYPEKYDIDNNEWADPIFNSLYKNTLSHAFINKILVKLDLKNDPIFNVLTFKKLLEKVTEERIGKQLKSPFNKTLKLKKDDRCIIFGDLHSSFHSLVRNLTELERQKVLNHNLQIISPDTYFIVLGDVINRGPYSLETLNVLLMLLEKNPEKLIYLKGNHETDSHWQNYNTRRQIQILFPKFADLSRKNNLFDLMDKFFDTLPDALVIEVAGKDNGYIICSNSEKPKLYENKKNIKFMIMGEKRFDVIKETTGLEFVGYDYGVAKWSLISCQNVVYEKFFNFKYDAFLELSIGQSASNCTLILNNRNANVKNPAFNQTFYDPIFGYKIKNKFNSVSKNICFIGSTMSLSGIWGPVCKEEKIGLEASIFFNNENKENLLLPVILDDGYSTRAIGKNINSLLNTYSLNTIVVPTGTPTLAFYINMAKEGKVYVFFPYTGAVQFRKKDIKNIIHFRGSYNDEAKIATNYIAKEFGIKNFAFFYQNDAYGEPPTQAAHLQLKKLGISSWIDLPHQKTQSEFPAEVEKLKTSMPEAIGCFSVEGPTREFIDELGSDFFAGKIVFGLSPLFSDSFQNFLISRGINFILCSTVPNPDNDAIEIVKEFKKNVSIRGFNITSNALEGYIAGSLISDAINKMKPPFTAEKIIKHFETMQNYNLKGLNLTFNPENRDLSQPIWIRGLDYKWVSYKIKGE